MSAKPGQPKTGEKTTITQNNTMTAAKHSITAKDTKTNPLPS